MDIGVAIGDDSTVEIHIRRLGHGLGILVVCIRRAGAALPEILAQKFCPRTGTLQRLRGLVLELGAPPAATRPLLERAGRYAREADAVMPGTKDVKRLQEAISAYRLLRSPAFPQRRNPLDPPTNV